MVTGAFAETTLKMDELSPSEMTKYQQLVVWSNEEANKLQEVGWLLYSVTKEQASPNKEVYILIKPKNL